MVIKTLDPLYKKTTTGAIQQWEIKVVKENILPVIVTTWGQLDGKKQETKEIVSEGKNIGKKNETTPLEQAMSQMKSYWEKRLKKGYVKNITDAENDKTDDIIKGGIVPMTAHKYWEQGHKITFPALAQPKLDGHRCTSQNKKGEVTMWSRARNQIKSIPHIISVLENFYISDSFDGELYNHDYKDRFEELTSLIKQEEPKNGYENIQFHVYDIINPVMDNYDRNLFLHQLKKDFEGTPIHIVETIVVHSQEELTKAYEHFMEQGYEGAMVRNFDGKYVHKKSYDLQKYKEFDDHEFEVVDVKVATKGKMAGLGIFVCKCGDKTFDCKMKGKLQDLKQYVDNPEKYIGKQLTVQFQGYTKKNNVPRFPVGLRFRIDI